MQRNEGIRIFHEHDFSDKEMAKGNPLIQIEIWLLFFGQLNITADRSAAGFLGTAVSSFHDSRPTAGHHGKTSLGEFGTGLPSETVIRMIFSEARRAENRNARPNKVELTKAPHEFEKNPRRPHELLRAFLRAFEKAHDFGSAGRRSPSVDGNDFVILCRHMGEYHHPSDRSVQ